MTYLQLTKGVAASRVISGLLKTQGQPDAPMPSGYAIRVTLRQFDRQVGAVLTVGNGLAATDAGWLLSLTSDHTALLRAGYEARLCVELISPAGQELDEDETPVWVNANLIA